MNSYDQPIMTQSDVAASKDNKTYTITLSAKQREVLLYFGLGLGGYILLKSLVKSAVRKLNDE